MHGLGWFGFPDGASGGYPFYRFLEWLMAFGLSVEVRVSFVTPEMS